jgi:hypothetical protein
LDWPHQILVNLLFSWFFWVLWPDLLRQKSQLKMKNVVCLCSDIHIDSNCTRTHTSLSTFLSTFPLLSHWSSSLYAMCLQYSSEFSIPNFQCAYVLDTSEHVKSHIQSYPVRLHPPTHLDQYICKLASVRIIHNHSYMLQCWLPLPIFSQINWTWSLHVFP